MSGLEQIHGGSDDNNDPPIDEFDVAEACQYLPEGDEILQSTSAKDLKILACLMVIGKDKFYLGAAMKDLDSVQARQIWHWFHPEEADTDRYFEYRSKAPSEPINLC